MAWVRLARHYLALVLLASQAGGQNAATDWFPVHVGDKWIYKYDTRDEHGEGRAHLDIHSWKTEEITIGVWTVPEGTLVGRQVRVAEGSPQIGWHVNTNPAALIHGGCLYAEVNWDPLAHQLAPDFLKGLGAYLSPDFCFPLVIHKTWGAPHGLPDWGVIQPEDAKDWRVAEIKVLDNNKTFHITSISSYPGGGVTEDIWFQRGVGPVREDDIHHGTIGERRTRLLRFEPAAPR
jgi:hypothetical protein